MPHTAASSMATKRPLHASNLADCFRKGANRVVLVIIVFFTRLLCATKLSIFPELSEGKAGKIQVGLRNTIRSFNPLRRAIERVSAIAGGQLCINPRPHGGATGDARPNVHFVPVSIHAPTGGGDVGVGSSSASSVFQSTPPRGGRPCQGICVVAIIYVSIHAPTGGRLLLVRPLALTFVSIHAPTGGATKGQDSPVLAHAVSIHAPTGGGD